jgi:hypothetical protein
MKQAKAIAKEILDKGLADSTFREQFPDAYKELLTYREDIEGSIEKKIKFGIGEDIKTKIMVVVPYYWGKGDNIAEAWQNVKKESGKNLRDLRAGNHRIYVAYDSDEVKTRMDDYGFNINYPTGYPPHIIEERINE